MSAYLVINCSITDQALLDEYVAAAGGTLGVVPIKVLAMDNESETIEGEPAGSRTVVLEFEDKESFRTWTEVARLPGHHRQAPRRDRGLRGARPGLLTLRPPAGGCRFEPLSQANYRDRPAKTRRDREDNDMGARVVHFEVPFDDGERALAFYRDVFDWDINAMPEMQYNIVSTGPTGDMGPTEPGYIGGGMLQRQSRSSHR